MRKLNIGVSIIEDDGAVRRLLGQWISRAKGFRCVSQHAGPATALMQLPTEKPELVLVDISMPTVSTYIRRIYDKLHVNSRGRAVAKFTQSTLSPLPLTPPPHAARHQGPIPAGQADDCTSHRRLVGSGRFFPTMNEVSPFPVLSAIASAALLATQLAAAQSPREHLSLDAGRKFHLGDDWPEALHLENSGTGSGPAAERFSDAYWRTVNLPHDWAVELPFDWAADGNHGFKTLAVKYPTNSIGWYRRTFELRKEDDGERIWLTFDGVFRDATVWVNGWCVRHHEGGYYPFREDITDLVHFGARNTVAAMV